MYFLAKRCYNKYVGGNGMYVLYRVSLNGGDTIAIYLCQVQHTPILPTINAEIIQKEKIVYTGKRSTFSKLQFPKFHLQSYRFALFYLSCT